MLFYFSLLTIGALMLDDAPYPNPQLLIEPGAILFGGSPPVMLDARPRAAFDAGHAPNARWVDASEWAKAFGDGDDVAGWTQRLGALGLEPSSRIAVYDDTSGRDAARVWWILRYWGFSDVRLVNGGWKAWQAAGAPVSKDPTPPVQQTQPRLTAAPDRLATKSELLASLPAKALQIIDARSEGEFCGTDARGNKRTGAIPGAKHLEWSDLVDKQNDRFKPASELAKLFADAGVDLTRPTAAHCQSGGRSSVMVFALELMGARDVANYHRSWAEWGNSDDTPIEPGKPK